MSYGNASPAGSSWAGAYRRRRRKEVGPTATPTQVGRLADEMREIRIANKKCKNPHLLIKNAQNRIC
jgi:hypothetical protein